MNLKTQLNFILSIATTYFVVLLILCGCFGLPVELLNVIGSLLFCTYVGCLLTSKPTELEIWLNEHTNYPH